MKKAVLLFVWMLIPAMLSAGSITGKVIDKVTHEALPHANVYIHALKRGVVTDRHGAFTLGNIVPGTYELAVMYVGYKKSLHKIKVSSSQTVTLVIEMVPTVLKGKEVVVTAIHGVRGETATPMAAIHQEEVQQRYHTQDIPVLLSELPSTTYYSESGNGIGYNYLSIRGFGQRRISVMINGIPQNDPEDHNVYWIDFPDFMESVSQVQVQRGAGSAFYGPPAIGGSVNIITKGFSNERQFTVSNSFGSFNTQKSLIAFNSGLINNRFVVQARYSKLKSDGYRDRSWVDFNSYYFGAAMFTKRSSLRLHLYGGPIKDHLAYYGISKQAALDRSQRKQNPITRPDEIENFNQPHLELVHQYQPTDDLMISNTVFGIRGYGFFDYDGSWAPASYYRLTPEYGFEDLGDPENLYVDDLLIRAYVDNKQAGWLTNVNWDSKAMKIVVGNEWRYHRSLHWGRIQKAGTDLPKAISGEYRDHNYIGSRRYYEYNGAKDIVSPFFHVLYRWSEAVNVVFDLQYRYLKYRLYNEKFLNNHFTITYHFFNPRVGVNYQKDNMSFFSSIAQTSREPRLKNFYDAAEASTPVSWGAVLPQFRINPDGNYNFDDPLVKPEKLIDYEVGMGLIGDQAELNVSFFYMDFNDEIIKKGQLDRFGQPITGNAEKTRHTGIELDGKLSYDHFDLNANLTFAANELVQYRVYRSATDYAELNGNTIAGFPAVLSNARLMYHNNSLSSFITAQYVGKQYTDNFNTEGNFVDPYLIFNGMLGYKFRNVLGMGDVTLQLFVVNMFDRLYITHGESDEFFPGAERHFYLQSRIEL